MGVDFMNGGWDYSKALFPVDFSVDCSNKNHQKRSSMVQPEAVLVDVGNSKMASSWRSLQVLYVGFQDPSDPMYICTNISTLVLSTL